MTLMRVTTSTFVRGLRTRPIAPYSHHCGQKSFSTTIMAASPQRHFQNPAVFVCDMQEKFRPAIWHFDEIILTAQKVLRAAQILKIPAYVTTQNGARLGATVSELADLLAATAEVSADKTAFSMLRVPEVAARFPEVLPPEKKQQREVAIVGIESHICVTQTALDLLARGHRVYVLADGVSSCDDEEVPLALARLRAAGVIVTTSESWLYECMGDAGIPEFKEIVKLVKEEREFKGGFGGLA
ncbi:Isochorismatase hydrolase [Annulohypoxylon truncatum]|uniref:Isochorismatase hydrolase n=1 Tax=Annulohypoxylon truncatum TaxID=327061 RepID=UPI002007FFC8|nr:Isochorismatase hydrolase [Annulohypoxylon truncatum]KAI1212460.1 Isochorismatase hydrolase [Annulohypoxylon truncatum]